MHLIAIDPGGTKKGCSAAQFVRGELVCVYPVMRAAYPPENRTVERVVIERPQQDARSRAVPPKILIELAWNGALLAGMFVGSGADLVEYTPDEWKGGVREDGKFIGGISKATHHANMIETGALATHELEVIGREFGVSWHELGGLVLAARRKEALARGAKHRNGHYSEAKEVARLPDVLDAVGLGAFDLGRIGKDGKRK